MDIWVAVILGVVEGLTEFIPVSSTGHMVIAMPLLGVDAGEPPWNVLLWVSQLGAIGAVIVYFWRDLWRRTFQPPSRDFKQHILFKLFVAMLPTGVIALALKEYLDPLERMPVAVAIALILGAGVMELIDRRFRKEGEMTLEDVTLWQAFWVGVIQTLSMVPGVSRSGASIMGGMSLGMTPRVATEFSFYLAIPTMLAAGVKTTLDHWDDMTREHALVVLVGTAVSFLVALFVVAGLMEFVKRYRFTVFAVYRVVLGLAVLGLAGMGWLS